MYGYLSRCELIFLKVTAPKADVISPKMRVDEMDEATVDRDRYFEIFSANQKVMGEKKMKHHSARH